MFYKLKNGRPFGTALDSDGRTVLGGSEFVQAGSIVESLSVGALDLILVKYTTNDGETWYSWLFQEDFEEAPNLVRILYDITEHDLLSFGAHGLVVLHEGAVVETNERPVAGEANKEWPIAVWLPDHSDYWYLRPEMYEPVEE